MAQGLCPVRKPKMRRFWKMKKIILAVMAIGMIMGITAISGPATAGEEVKMGFYSIAPPFSPLNTSMDKMKASLAEKSGGRIKMTLYPSGQLGPESAGLNKLKFGAVQAAGISGVAISTIEPKANVLMMPFVIETWEDVEKFANGKVMGEIGKSLEKKGFKLMGAGSYGFFNTLSKNKALVKPDDFKGVKIRVYPAPVLVDLYKILGASPTPISFPEIYTALQQGVIEATDGTLDSSDASKQYEVAKYLSRTNHIHGWFLYMVNKKWFEGLSREDQALIAESFKEYVKVEREEIQKVAEKILKSYKEKGVEIRELTDDERAVLRKKTAPIHEKYRGKIGPQLMDEFYAELDYQTK
jgi:TRAP-type transport system periplasmic protein